MAGVTVIKDLVEKFEVTGDVPVIYGGSSPTWETYKGSNLAKRISGDSDRPNEQTVMEEVLDGRSVQSSVEQDFAQMIFEDADSTTIYDIFKNAAQTNNSVWLRRTGKQSEAVAEIIGGSMGLTVGIAKERPGRDGHRLFVVEFSAVSEYGGTLIEEDTS